VSDYRRSASPYGLTPPQVPNALVSSARLLVGAGDPIIQHREWQREAWDFYDAMGEFWYGTTWLSNAMSRVRLVAAKLSPGGDEPEILRDDQTAADEEDPTDEDLETDEATEETAASTSKKNKAPQLTPAEREIVRIVEAFGGGIGGQSAILKQLTVQLSVPGEGFVVGEQKVLDEESQQLSTPAWTVKSSDEIRRREYSNRSARKPKLLDRIGPGVARAESSYEVQVEENQWVALSGESVVCRVWQPHPRYSWRATSAALPALPIMREIDLYNRRIISDLVSRLASNGILIIPEEATFAVNPEFKDAPDPFVAELIATAAQAIKNPGSASAVIPIPIKVPMAMVEKFVHLTFAAAFDAGILDARDRAIKRLATTLAMPEEVLLGVQNVNHWTAWQIDESGIKLHIAPIAEIIVDALTKGYLEPMLAALQLPLVGEDGSRYVIWYDVSELTAKPDLGDAADTAHASATISDAAYRREKGFTEDDAPNDEELQKQVMRALALTGNTQAIGVLFPDLAEAMSPPPPPGFDEQGRPLAPPDSTTVETTEEEIPDTTETTTVVEPPSGAASRGAPKTKKPGA
jgi:hypothetical protein